MPHFWFPFISIIKYHPLSWLSFLNDVQFSSNQKYLLHSNSGHSIIIILSICTSSCNDYMVFDFLIVLFIVLCCLSVLTMGIYFVKCLHEWSLLNVGVNCKLYNICNWAVAIKFCKNPNLLLPHAIFLITIWMQNNMFTNYALPPILSMRAVLTFSKIF